MINVYSFIKDAAPFRQLTVNELLFSEYTCMQEETKFGIWSDCNYFSFVTSGKKTWKTIHHDYEANDGDILFVKKGANLTHQFFQDEFCAIFLFIPDHFIRTFLQTYASSLNISTKEITNQDAVLRLKVDDLLSNYANSLGTLFSVKNRPSEELIKLKFEELLLSIFNDQNNTELASYFLSLCQDRQQQMTQVMEENFAYNLKIEDYAQLSNMSLSSFKSAFKKRYNSTPAAWLKGRKLDLATQKLKITDLTINQLSLECGFEDTSHFIRVFKQKHGITPLQYRLNQSKDIA